MDPYTIRLDPTSRDHLLRMMVAEAGSLGVPGMAAVADTVFNRVSHPYFQEHAGGSTIDDILTADGQFEPWARYGRDWQRFPNDPELMALAGDALDSVIAGNAELPFEGSLFFQNRAITQDRGTDFHNADAYLGEIGSAPVSHSHYGAMPGMSPLPGYRIVTGDEGMPATVALGPVPGQPMGAMPSGGLLASSQPVRGGLLGEGGDFPLYGILGLASGLMEAGAPSVGVPRSPGAMALRGAMQGMQMDAAQEQAQMQRALMEAQIADLGRADPTSDIQNYLFALQNGFDGTFAEFLQSRRGPMVSVNMPSVPAGYMVTERGPDGQAIALAPTPGGPAELERRQAEEQASRRQEQTELQGSIVAQDIDRAIDLIDNSDWPVAGFWGWMLGQAPGTAGANLQATLDTIGANIGFDRLQQMRENSPTGGALGNVSEMENRLLQSVYGSLSRTQSPEQLRTNLQRLRTLYDRVINEGIGDDEAQQLIEEFVPSRQQQPRSEDPSASVGAVPPPAAQPLTVQQARGLTTRDVQTMNAQDLAAILSNEAVRDAVSDEVFDAIEMRMIVLREASRR